MYIYIYIYVYYVYCIYIYMTLAHAIGRAAEICGRHAARVGVNP